MEKWVSKWLEMHSQRHTLPMSLLAPSVQVFGFQFSGVFAMVLYVFRINSVLKQPLKHVFSWQTIENYQ